MPSRTVAVAVVAMVLLSGCSMLGGGGDDASETTVGEPPDHHEFVFASSTNGHPFGATITVTKGSETLFSKRTESDGASAFENLTTLDEPGPYTVTVNTTLPESGGGNMSESFDVAGDLGDATVLSVSYSDIERASFTLPRRQMKYGLGYFSSSMEAVDVRVIARRGGEQILDTTFTAEHHQRAKPVADLTTTGAYQIAVRAGDEWLNKTVVVPEPGRRIEILVGPNGYPEAVAVETPIAELTPS